MYASWNKRVPRWLPALERQIGSWPTRAAADRRLSLGWSQIFWTIFAKSARTQWLRPIGFLSDHMEVIYDLDTEAKAVAEELGIRMVRAETVGTHPLMIEMIAEMVKVEPAVCAAGCCAAPARRPS